MKIAISGKGGVGKTTLAALLIKYFKDQGKKVLAVDADPDANLALALGIPDPENITPICEMRELVHERTECEPGKMGGMFKMNPKVDDIPDRFSRKLNGIKLIVMGTVKKGGAGCVCPESVMLKALMTNIVLFRDEVVEWTASSWWWNRAAAASKPPSMCGTWPRIWASPKWRWWATKLGDRQTRTSSRKTCPTFLSWDSCPTIPKL
jgi:hypothetical protein